MHFKAENLTIPKHPQLLFLAQNLGVLRPSKTMCNFFWDTLYNIDYWLTNETAKYRLSWTVMGLGGVEKIHTFYFFFFLKASLIPYGLS